MLDLISTTEELHYENYRQTQMETRKFGEPRVKKVDNPKFREEEEILRKRFTEQVKAEEVRFRQWEHHVCDCRAESFVIESADNVCTAYRGARQAQ
jgi:cell division control protein 12